jgi:glycosyltransferase involved in cell wall biosynthesis
MNSLSIVIPAHNEAANIGVVVRDALDVGSREAGALEVIVLDDGSTDATGDLLAALATFDPRLRVLRHRENLGIEASLRTLYAATTSEWVFAISADQQWPMSCLSVMASEARRGADLVVGQRPGKRRVYGIPRRILSISYDWVVRVLGSPVGDPGSVKLGRRQIFTTPVAARGVLGEGERVVRAARRGVRIVGCPVEFRRRERGVATGARPSIVAHALVDVARMVGSLYLGWPRAEL